MQCSRARVAAVAAVVVTATTAAAAAAAVTARTGSAGADHLSADAAAAHHAATSIAKDTGAALAGTVSPKILDSQRVTGEAIQSHQVAATMASSAQTACNFREAGVLTEAEQWQQLKCSQLQLTLLHDRQPHRHMISDNPARHQSRSCKNSKPHSWLGHAWQHSINAPYPSLPPELTHRMDNNWAMSTAAMILAMALAKPATPQVAGMV